MGFYPSHATHLLGGLDKLLNPSEHGFLVCKMGILMYPP